MDKWKSDLTVKYKKGEKNQVSVYHVAKTQQNHLLTVYFKQLTFINNH